MDQLRPLGLQERWIYEVLISTFRHGVPHAAPIGVWTDGPDELQMDVYEGSQTLRNIVEDRHFVVNFPGDAVPMHEALHSPGRLTFAEACCVPAPVVVGCTAVVELAVCRVSPEGERARVVGAVRHVRVSGSPRLINRAEGLLLESLVLVTRLEHLDPSAVLATLMDNHRVAEKVAPGSVYERALAALVREISASS